MAIHAACVVPDPEKIRSLLLNNLDINVLNGEKCTPLHAVCRYELHEESFDKYSELTMQVVNLLLDAGANINDLARDGATPLSYTAMRKNTPLVKLLLDRGANPMLGDFMMARMITASNLFMKEKHAEALAMIDSCTKSSKKCKGIFLKNSYIKYHVLFPGAASGNRSLQLKNSYQDTHTIFRAITLTAINQTIHIAKKIPHA